jgi:flagellar hook-associated protein 3 FlgL
MRISSTNFATNFLNTVNSLTQQQNKLQNEASTGLKVQLPEDNPSAMADVLNLQSNSTANAQYQTNIQTLQSAATTSSSAMTSLQTIINRVNEIATAASNGTTSSTQYADYTTEVGQLIQQALQLGNTQDADGNYIFSGTNTTTKPFVATTDSSGNVTGVTYQGNSEVASAEIAPNVTISAQTPGANTTGSGATGLFTDSNSGADLFNHMISLQQDLKAGNTAAISANDVPELVKDDNNIIYQISANGVAQSSLQSASAIATTNGTNITTQISNESNADLATVLTQLEQTQNSYQAALASGAQIFGLSLLNYLQ